jgi:hypothetical protein
MRVNRAPVFTARTVRWLTVLFTLIMFAPGIYYGFHMIIDRDCSHFMGASDRNDVPERCKRLPSTTTTKTTATTATSTTEETTTTPTTTTTEETTTSTTEETTSTTEETTTTEGPTTEPSAFSLVCPPDYLGNIEDTVVPTNYSVTGTGCGGSPINVNFVDNTILSRRDLLDARWEPRRSPERRQSLNQTMMLPKRTMFMTGTSVNVTIATPVFNVTNASTATVLDRSSSGRYVGLPNAAFVNLWLPAVIGGGAPVAPYEVLVSSAGDNSRHILFDNVGASDPALVYAPGGFFTAFFSRTAIFPLQCTFFAPVFFMDKALFDYEAQRYVLVVMAGQYICMSLSANNDPFSSWTSYLFSDVNFAYTHGFSAQVWGDYYLLCWNNGQSQQNCAAFDRTSALAGASVQYLIMQNFISPIAGGFGLSPVIPLGQQASTRGDLISLTAPCGVFATLDEGAQMIRYGLCSNLVFGSMTPPTITVKSVPVNGGWNSGYNLLCQIYNGGTGCIPVDASPLMVIPLSNYLRASYYNYGTYEGE